MNIHKHIVAAILLLIASLTCAQTVEYIHTDALGSPVAITNASGVVIERTVYEPYGAVINRPLNNRPGYTGHVEDAVTGLNYMQQRYYDPQLGRFLSNDPVTATSVGGNFNRYAYARNSPYGRIDPSGAVDVGACTTYGGCVQTGNRPMETGEKIILGIAIAGPLVGTATVGALTSGTAAVATGDAAATALTAANVAADSAVASGAVTTTSAASSGIVSAEGVVAGGVSTGGGGAGITSPVVQALYDAVPAGLRNAYTGACAEACGMSNLVNAGGKLQGSTMGTIRIASRKLMDACPACKWVAEKAGVNLVGK